MNEKLYTQSEVEGLLESTRKGLQQTILARQDEITDLKLHVAQLSESYDTTGSPVIATILKAIRGCSPREMTQLQINELLDNHRRKMKNTIRDQATEIGRLTALVGAINER